VSGLKKKNGDAAGLQGIGSPTQINKQEGWNNIKKQPT